MIRLKILLQSKIFYIVLFIFLFVYCFYYYKIPFSSNISLDDNKFVGRIDNIKIDKDLLTLELKGYEKIIAYYYFKTEEEVLSFKNNYNLGDIVSLKGSFYIPSNNTILNGFNYKKYLYYKHIYMCMNVDNITKLKSNSNFIYFIKNELIKHISKYKSKNYLETFVLGDKNSIDKDSLSNYRENGVSHLLAISGMHISLLSCFILALLKKIGIKETKSLLLTSIFLIFYMFLTGLMASVCRSVLLFILLSLNRVLKLSIKTIYLFLLTLFIIVLINPFIVFDIGFLYSFTVSFYLILFQNELTGSYIRSLFMISLISFLVGLPITLYYFYEINFLSIILNMIYVPLVSIIIFPFSLITFFLPFLDNIFYLLTNTFENLSSFTSSINVFKIVFGKVSVYFIIMFYLFITLFLKTNKKKYFLLIMILLIVRYNISFIFPKNYVLFIDVGQGDSILIHSKNKNILIDTGGKTSLKKENWQRENKSITDSKLIPLFKSLGIRKLDYLVLTHGDFDHMGEAINLVENFKVEKVIFNCGPYNDLEQELIKVLDKKKIKYYSCIKELNIDNNKLYFLQTKEYDNENDNSNVIYTELDGYKFMFMGDASITTEKEILNKYNLPDIDVLKVGHHGSKTSSGKEFINEISPKYSIISVGKNNRYGHPNKEVLNNLENSKIYRTDQDGSIILKINNNKLKIETCSP